MRPLLCTTVLLFLAGCETIKFGEKEDTELCAISFHAVVTHEIPSKLQRKFDTADGGQVTLDTFPVLTSRQIVSIEPYRIPGGMALRFHLDRKGHFRWTSTATEYNGRRLAMVVDDVVRAYLTVSPYAGDETFSMDAPFNSDDAVKIARRAPRNYEKLNER